MVGQDILNDQLLFVSDIMTKNEDEAILLNPLSSSETEYMLETQNTTPTQSEEEEEE